MRLLVCIQCIHTNTISPPDLFTAGAAGGYLNFQSAASLLEQRMWTFNSMTYLWLVANGGMGYNYNYY